MFWIFLGILLFANGWSPFATAQTQPLPLDSLRQRVDLNGEWSCKIKGKSAWQSVRVPSLIQEQGSLFFRRTFELPSQLQDSQFLLVFEGVNFSCQVKVNDQYLATQTHGFTPLVIPVPSSLLRFQQPNQLEIELNTTLSKASMPAPTALLAPAPLRGIFRDVYLQVLPPLAITAVHNQVQFSADLIRVTVRSQIQIQAAASFLHTANAAAALTLTVNLWEAQPSTPAVLSLQKTINSAELAAGTVDLSFELTQPQLWRLDSPFQYHLQIILADAQRILDSYDQNLGLRQLLLRNHQLVLNGTPIILRGVTLIEDQEHWLTLNSTLALLTTVHALGFNCVSWFTPPPAQALALADSLGLMSILGVPIWNLPSPLFTQPSFRDNAVSLTKRLAVLAEHHPSVIALSLGSGYDAEQSGSYELIKLLRKQITATSDFYTTAGFRNYPKIRPDLPLDFLTVDLTRPVADNLAVWLEQWSIANPGLPVMCAGIAVPFIPTQQDSENVSLFESEQAQLLKKSITTILASPTLGYVLVTLYDWQGVYPTLLTPLQPQSQIFPLGIADATAKPRMAWNMIQNLNSNQPDQFSFEKASLSPQSENVFLFAGLVVMIFFLIYFRKDHRLRGNFIRVLIRPFGFHSEIKEGRKIPWSITSIMALTVAFTWALLLGSLFYFLRQNLLFDFLLAQLSLLPRLNLLLIQLTWHPVWGLIGFGLIILILLSLLSVYVYIMAIIFGKSLSLHNAVTFVFWESSIFVFLLPIAFVFYRMLFIWPLRLPLLILLILFCLWFLYRLYRGMVTIFAFRRGLSLLLFLGLPILIVVVVMMIFNHSRALNAFLVYLYHMWNVQL